MDTRDWKDFDYIKWQKLDDQFDHKAFEEQVEKAIQTDDAFSELGVIKRPPWRPSIFYDEERDRIQIYLADVIYTARYLTPELTVFVSDVEEVVGLEIKQISKIIAKKKKDG